MKKSLAALILIFNVCFVNGQNFVPNPSFEDTAGCPTAIGQIYKAQGWTTFRGSPDYLNPCANLNTPYLGIPNNFAGYQMPKDGNSYAGLVTYTNALPFPYREYLGVQLLHALSPNMKYYTSAFISSADSLNDKCSTNKFGFRFSTIPYSGSSPLSVDNLSHIHSDSIVTEKMNWTKISGSFIADSAYVYLIIGNFYDDINTDTLNCSNGGLIEAYYYLDAVCVSSDSIYSENWLDIYQQESKGDKVQIYPNPANDKIHFSYLTGKTKYSLSEISGKTIREGVLLESENAIDVSFLSEGIYLLEIEKKHFLKAIIIH